MRAQTFDVERTNERERAAMYTSTYYETNANAIYSVTQ